MWNKNETQGKIDEVKGRAKQAVADVTDDPILKEEGEDQEVAGKVESAVGNAQHKVGKAIEDVGKAIKR